MSDETMIARITQILRELNQGGGFNVSVLTDDRGLALACASEADQEAQTQAAVVALVEKAAGRVTDQLGMGATDEVAVSDTHGRVLVCRRFSAADKGFILSILVPGRQRPYRLLTNRAVRSLQRILESL
ncbi:MAG: hypothetical protein A2Y93_17540 [Chloroflexi bacterium RBG_13_68_17]|nr:MAG: hypothetical protein A2Y93_17540 [Chloroflexi bacterium RBG_13_68_17]